MDPRSIDYWTALAKTDVAAKDFAEAQKAWSGAERAAASDEERERIRKVRLDVQEKRFDYDAAERKRLARRTRSGPAAREEPERSRHPRLRRRGPQEDESEWRRAAETGSLVRSVHRMRVPVCRACFSGWIASTKRARLVIQTSDGKTVQLLMADPSQVSSRRRRRKNVQSAALRKHARQVTVHYNAKPDAKLHTVGVVLAIEFH